jgi:uncharacterized protein YecT (DUF1311 family)
MLARVGSAAVLALLVVAAAVQAQAQSRKPTAREVAAIRDCATKTKDDVDAGEGRCLFKLVADPCMAPVGAAPDRVMADCFQIEGVIWDDLLNENYKSLLASLDDEQTAKARAMQRACIAYRDTTCGFYADKIQGTMAGFMEAACVTRETARRATLLAFFSRL